MFDRDGNDNGNGNGSRDRDWAEQRSRLVDRLRQRERVTDDRVFDALEAVPRHEFVPKSQRSSAYRDRPLPIGEGQTISAPHMVAIMAARLDLGPELATLEIGTGCGYHAAVTAELVGAEHVYTVEYHDSLAEQARERLARLGYEGVSVLAGDGKRGWPEHAPYDRAYLTCAAAEFPTPVVEQLRPGGLVLGPIGDRRQVLVRGRRREDGTLEREQFGGVRFVDMQ